MTTKKISKKKEYVFKKKWIKDNIKHLDVKRSVLEWIDKHVPAKEIKDLFYKDEWTGVWYLGIDDSVGTCFDNNCGIIELPAASVALINLLQAHLYNYRIAVCSLNAAQRKMLAGIKKLGFKVVHPWGKNPNSGNDICMLSIDLNKKFKL